MSLQGRLMSAYRAFIRYDEKNLTPKRGNPYGESTSRIMRYDTADEYYYNTVFDKLNALGDAIKEREDLYRFIRMVHNPVPLENKLFQSYTYKGTIDTKAFKTGSLPMVFDNNRLLLALQQVIKWSNLDQQLGTYVKNAALYGDTAWWVCDEPDRNRVRLECIDPARVKHVQRDSVGNIKACVIEYTKYEEIDIAKYLTSKNGVSETPKSYKYTMIADRDWFYTYKDDAPFAYQNDVRGNPVWKWPNPFGFVPLKLSYFTMGQDGWGQNSFFGIASKQIKEISDLVSLTGDSIRAAIQPTVAAIGVTAPTEDGKVKPLKPVRDAKSGVTIIYLPTGAEMKPVTVPLDIAGAMAHYKEMMNNLEKNMPVIALSKIRDIGGNLSGLAISNMFGDAISSIQNLRKNLDPGLVSALQMAITIGGVQGYDGFSGITMDSYDRGDMEITIGDRPIIDDGMDKQQKLTNIISLATLPSGSKRAGYVEMGFSEDKADEIIAEDKEETDASTRMAARGLADSLFPQANTDVNGGSTALGAGQDKQPLQLADKVAQPA